MTTLPPTPEERMRRARDLFESAKALREDRDTVRAEATLITREAELLGFHEPHRHITRLSRHRSTKSR
jgi:hypothetical protein